MNMKRLGKPLVIFLIGLVMSVAVCLVTGMKKAPTVTEHDFRYSVTYKLDGEVKTFEGVYRCKFNGFSEGTYPLDRFYEGEYSQHGLAEHSDAYTIAQKNGLDLCIVTAFNSSYLMNDVKNDDYEPSLESPYLLVYDGDGAACVEGEKLGAFDAEIISWEYPEPVDNTFVFAGFSRLNNGSMLAMILVWALVTVACIVFVKKDPSVTYGPFDKAAVIFHYAVGFLALPFITVVVLFLELTMSGWEYQLCLCVPPAVMFCTAASIALRRKGFAKTGLYVQVLLPGLIFAFFLVRSIVYEILNIF